MIHSFNFSISLNVIFFYLMTFNLFLQTLMDKGKLFVQKLVDRVGFFGILGCASVR